MIMIEMQYGGTALLFSTGGSMHTAMAPRTPLTYLLSEKKIFRYQPVMQQYESTAVKKNF